MVKSTKNATLDDDLVNDDALVNDVEGVEESILREFSADQSSDTWLVKVFRDRTANSEKMRWLFDCTPSDLPVMGKLRDEYGSGDYRVMIYRNNRLYRNIPMSIETPIKPIEVKAPDTGISALAQILERQTAMIERLAQSQNAPAQSSNPIDMMKAVMETVIQANKLMPQQPVTQGLDAEKAFGLIMKGFEAGQTISRGDDKEDGGMMGLLRDLIKSPLAERLLEGAAQAQAMQASQASQYQRPQMPPPIADKVQPAIVETKPATDNIQDNQQMMINSQLAMLVGQAERGADVDLYADLILDNVPPAVLHQFISDPDLIAKAAKVNPAVDAHKEWFIRLITSIKSALNDETSTLTDDKSDVTIDDHVRTTTTTEPNANT